jgi:hypothetical protein
MKKESISTNVEANSGGIAETDDIGARGDSPAGSSRLTAGSTQGGHITFFEFCKGLLTHTIPDSIILSDDEPLATGSETDYSEVDLGPRAKSDSDSPHVTDSGSFGLGTTFISGCPVSDHQDEDGDNSGVPDDDKLRLAANYLRPRSVSPGQTFTHQASKMQVDTDITQGTMSSMNLDVAEVDDQGFDIFTNRSDKQDRSDAGARFSGRQKLSDIHQNNSTFDSGISAHNGSRDHAQPLQLDLAAPHQQPDPTPEPLPAAHGARKSAPRHARNKRPRSTGLATAVSTASTVLKSTNLKIRQSRAPATDLT